MTIFVLNVALFCQVHQQNRQLKRQSQLLVQSLNVMNVDITKMVESADDLNDNSVDVDQMEHLNAIIEGQPVTLSFIGLNNSHIYLKLNKPEMCVCSYFPPTYPHNSHIPD